MKLITIIETIIETVVGNASDEEAFHRSISSAPSDEAPRLVYADWRDENDENGDLIRSFSKSGKWPALGYLISCGADDKWNLLPPTIQKIYYWHSVDKQSSSDFLHDENPDAVIDSSAYVDKKALVKLHKLTHAIGQHEQSFFHTIIASNKASADYINELLQIVPEHDHAKLLGLIVSSIADGNIDRVFSSIPNSTNHIKLRTDFKKYKSSFIIVSIFDIAGYASLDDAITAYNRIVVRRVDKNSVTFNMVRGLNASIIDNPDNPRLSNSHFLALRGTIGNNIDPNGPVFRITLGAGSVKVKLKPNTELYYDRKSGKWYSRLALTVGRGTRSVKNGVTYFPLSSINDKPSIELLNKALNDVIG